MTTLELNKEIGFYFDEKEHAYFLDGKPMHGVTSILRVIAKPALIQWAANMAVDFISTNLDLSMTAEQIKALFDDAKKAHARKKEDAGEKGSDVHETIENLIKLAIKTTDGRIVAWEKTGNSQLDNFVGWARENDVRFLESEKRVYSESAWYAGTCDLVFEMDGKKYIGDVKTGRAIYPEYYLQMAAYQNALEEMGEHTDIHGAVVINLKKTGGIEIGMNYDYQGNKLAFLGFLTGYKQLQALTK